MKTALYRLSENSWEKDPKGQTVNDENVNLVLCFASKLKLSDQHIYDSFKAKFPSADIAMTSTAGEIYQEKVLDDSVIVVAVQFEKTMIESISVNIKDYKNTYEAAMSLGKKLPKSF